MEEGLSKKAKVKNLPFNKADMQITWADITKAEKLLGWKPEISFEDGLKDCIDHYQANLDFYKSIKISN